MLEEFKKFIMKGNLIEIAVGLILALKFTDVVNAFVDGLISPIIGAVAGAPSFKDKTLEIGDGVLLYGAFIEALVAFLITGFVLFLIVKAYNAAKDLRKGTAEEEDETPDDILLLREIRDLLRQRQ
jgi:large conductance mechanosensitive channel